jgi:tRNA(Ile)-lysidine synthase
LLPAIRKFYPNADENLLRNMERFRNINQVYRSSIDKMMKEVSVQHGEELHIPVNKLKKYESSALIFEIISAYGFHERQVQEVYKLMEAESGKFIENQDYQIIRHRKWLVIAPKKDRSAIIAIEKGRVEVLFDGGSVTMNTVNREGFKLDRSENMAQLDARHIEYPLVLRRWKQGDYFYPLGMRKKKKLARFFIDQKLSKIQKENIWVLESKNRIIWILGHRIDDRFKITESTKEIIQFSTSIL